MHNPDQEPVLIDNNGTISPESTDNRSINSKFANKPPFPYAYICLESFAHYRHPCHIASATLEDEFPLGPWIRDHNLEELVDQIHQRRSPEINPVDFKVGVAKAIKPIAGFDNRLDVGRAVAEELGVRMFIVGPEADNIKSGERLLVRCKDLYHATRLFLKSHHGSLRA